MIFTKMQDLDFNFFYIKSTIKYKLFFLSPTHPTQ